MVDGSPDIKDNTVQSNQIGINIIGGAPHIYGGDSSGGGNIITGNTQYGVYIGTGADLAGLNIEWNDIHGNGVYPNNYGIYGETVSSPYWYAKCNWWGENDNTGPWDPSLELPYYNPNGHGDRVSDYVDYVNYIEIDPGTGVRTCTGQV